MNQLNPLLLLTLSNVFMTFAWYGHLKNMKTSPLWIAIMSSWGIAFFEYCLQVPANRMGSEVFSLSQLKISQEIITMIVFAVFSIFYMKVPITRNYLYASLCLLGAAFFLFRD
jgi:uncharacterized protein (DUF486 family)